MVNNAEYSEQWWIQPAAALDVASAQHAKERQAVLTKPPGALGRLEDIAIQFSAWRGQAISCLDHISIRIFAADHGVAIEGVSAFPQEVTAAMVRNFARGGAAINVLARKLGADFLIINLGTRDPLEPLPGVLDARIAAGTGNFARTAAMTDDQLKQALQLGAQQVSGQEQLVIGGEMGIGNTSSAAACAAAVLGRDGQSMVGRGTGIDDDTLRRKIVLVDDALQRHSEGLKDELHIMQCLGGLEIAALVGYYIRAAQQGVPSLIDGYISSVAALFACRLNSGVRDWLMFSHRSAEQPHQIILDELNARPLLDVEMRLGEATGAAIAVDLIRSALALHTEMATFEEAGIL